MSEVNLFEVASRKNWSFNSTKGQLVVSDLWTMPLSKGAFSLDAVAIAISEEAESSKSKSFVTTPRPGSAELAQKLELVVHIINVRLAEVDIASKLVERKAMRQKIAAVKDRKKDAEMDNMTIEQLDALEKSL